VARPRIYIVDDDALVRAALSLELEGAYDVMAFAAAQHFLDAAPSLPFGCLLLDVHMPGIDGLDLQRRLVEDRLPFPVVMITGQADIGLAVRAMKAGAVDFLAKPFSREAVIESVGLAQQRLGEPVSGNGDRVAAAARLTFLTPRERQVLKGLVAGWPNKTIAYDLGISARTVEKHRAQVMGKMQARSFSELIRLAVAAGLQERD